MTEGLTRKLCEGLHDLGSGPLPRDVREKAQESLLHTLGVAIGGSDHEAVDLAVSVTRSEYGEQTVVAAPGRSELLDPIGAALVTGLATHVHDFDDTHLETVIHPGASTLGAALAAGQLWEASGKSLVTAFALGIEAQLRIGAAMSPWHYDDGWHITGTCGPIGAAIAAGLLRGLDADGLVAATGIAASQTLGIREAFGTMMKPYHAGKAASNGLLAATLAAEGFTSPEDVLTAPRGFFSVLSPRGVEVDRVLDGLGERWELDTNTFKPYPCGVVSHPVIDAAVALAARLADTAEVADIEAHVNPLVVELTGERHPQTGLAAKFSSAHGLAVGMRDGHVDLSAYTDTAIADPQLVQLRERVSFITDPDTPRDAAFVRVQLTDGTKLEEHVPHARGSLKRPLTRGELVDKVRTLVEPVLPGLTDTLIDAVGELHAAPTLDGLVGAMKPQLHEVETGSPDR